MTFIILAIALAIAMLSLRLKWLSTLFNENGDFTVDAAFVRQFHDLLLLQYQQMKTLLENKIEGKMVHRGVHGEIDHHDRLGAAIANDIFVRHGDTTYLNPPHSKRACRLIPSDGAILLDKPDEVRMLINPISGYRETIVAALGRRADQHIINAALGTALTGIDGVGTQALPTGQKIAKGTSPNDVLTYAKIKTAANTLSKASVPTGPKNRLFLYSPGQLNAILAISQATSSDFTKSQIVDRGGIDGVEWMGFTWIEIPDVLDPTGTLLQRMLPYSGTTRQCIAMGNGSCGLSIGRSMTSYIDVLPGKRHATQVRAEMDMASVRVWDTAVVEVDCIDE